MSISKEIDPTEFKNIFRFLHGTDSPGLNQYSHNGSFTYFAHQPIKLPTAIERKKSIHCNQIKHC